MNLENFKSNLLEIDKKSQKNIGIYNIEISQRKKLMIVKILTVLNLCICVLIMRVDILNATPLKKKA